MCCQQERRYPRRTIFARFSTSYASWAPGSHGREGAPHALLTFCSAALRVDQQTSLIVVTWCVVCPAEYKDRLPAELWELMQQGGFQSEKAVVTRLLAEQRERRANPAPRM